MKKNSLKGLILVIIFLLAIGFSACMQSPKVQNIKVGEEYNWYQGEGYTYSSSNDDIALINQHGVILGVSDGQCTVYAKSINDTVSLRIEVLKNVAPSYVSPVTSQDDTSSVLSEISSKETPSQSISSIESDSSQSQSNIKTSLQESSSSSLTTSSQSSQIKEIFFTLDVNGGEINDSNWQEYLGKYVCYELCSLPTPVKEGFDFLGWKTGEEYITEVIVGQEAVAHWQEKSYQVEYVLNGGENNPLNPSVYNYFDDEFVLQPAYKQNEYFVGWYLDQSFSVSTTVIPNTKQKVTLYAKFVVGYSATFIYDGANYSTFAEVGEKFAKPQIDIENGYFIEWFTTDAYLQSYNFDLPAQQDIILYGKKYTELASSFFGYANRKLTKVNNMTEFQYYLEYTYFNEISSNNEIEVSQEVYETLTGSDETTMSLIFNKATMPFISLTRSSRKSGNKYYYQVLIPANCGVTDNFNTQELLSLEQYDHVHLAEESKFVATRDENFDDFKYQQLQEEVSVKNSNQLFFALEHNVKPIPVANSNAEIALNKSKAILRSIISNDMSDEEKVLKIYRYLCYNVTYNLPTVNGVEALNYDCFYMEGVLNNNQAVCDGIAKTLSVLCNLEGIRCVRTASTSHAWNEVFINGQWYVIDVTHGNLGVSTSSTKFEVLTHNNFLLSETVKESVGCQDILRTEIVANGQYSYYQENTFTYNNVEYDYVISSKSELTTLLKWCKEQDSEYNFATYTVDIIVDDSYTTLLQDLSSARLSAGMWGATVNYINDTDYMPKVFILVIS